MEKDVIQMAMTQGGYAILFVYLLFYVLKENSKRENKYQNIITDLTQKFNILDDVKSSVKKIEEKLH